jgi:hypothetical protein
VILKAPQPKIAKMLLNSGFEVSPEQQKVGLFQRFFHPSISNFPRFPTFPAFSNLYM